MLLNSTQVKKIFDKYSFLFGTQDVVNAAQIGEMFGDEAVIYAIHNHSYEQNAVALDLGNNHSHVFLTFAGFKQVVSYSNQQEIINQDKQQEQLNLQNVMRNQTKTDDKVIFLVHERKHNRTKQWCEASDQKK